MASILFKRAIYHAAALNSLRPGAYARNSKLPPLSIMSPTIAIIGAGPCGLTLARLLECNNIDYVVYERDTQSAPAQQSKAGVGGSLDLHPESGQKALQVAGLYDEFKRRARWDATGFVLATQEGEVKARVGEGRDAPEIDRHQLRQMLIDSVPPRKIQWEHGVKALERLGDGRFNVKFSNGQSVSDFKLVVGTDGAWSKVRPMVSIFRDPRCCSRLTHLSAHLGQACVLRIPLYRRPHQSRQSQLRRRSRLGRQRQLRLSGLGKGGAGPADGRHFVPRIHGRQSTPGLCARHGRWPEQRAIPERSSGKSGVLCWLVGQAEALHC